MGFLLLSKGCIPGPHDFASVSGLVSHSGCLGPHEFTLVSPLSPTLLESNRELQFRVSLARHALGIDTVPTLDSVTKFAMHLLSECEQPSQTEKKNPAPATKNEVKVKSLDYDKEESKGKGKGKERSFEDEKGECQRKCKFYLTTEGCRKGKECRYSHAQRDGKRRCYTCGSTEHMAPDCPRKPSTEGSPPKQKTAKAEGDQVAGGAKIRRSRRRG